MLKLYDDLKTFEDNGILRQIADRTERGQIKWECSEYTPICFLNRDAVDEEPACLAQLFTLNAVIDGLPHELELAERIYVPSGKGDLLITLRRDVPGDFLEIFRSLSCNADLYDDCRPEELCTRFRSSPIVKLSSALGPQMFDADDVEDIFQWARYIYEQGIPARLREHPLTRLGEELFNEHRILDFHRCVLDVAYREELLNA